MNSMTRIKRQRKNGVGISSRNRVFVINDEAEVDEEAVEDEEEKKDDEESKMCCF